MATWPIPPRIELDDILPFLSPGSVIGVYDDGGWVDWEAEPSGPVVTLSGYDLLHRLSADPDRYVCVVPGSGVASAELHGAIAVLLAHSRGLALVTPRVGLLLGVVHRILCPSRDRHSASHLLGTSGPHPQRTSGPWASPVTRSLRLVDPAEVARSAALSVRVEHTFAAAWALADHPGVRVSGDLIHLPLDGGTPEEILERLKAAGIRVGGSAVWYSLLQSSPFENGATAH